MGLGTNRDYKSSERRVLRNLARHAVIMQELIAHGMSRGEASAQALAEMEGTKTRMDALLRLYPKSNLPA